MRRLALVLFAIALVGIGALAGNFYLGWVGKGPLEETRQVVIPPGATLKSAARLLKAEGAVRSADAFYLRARVLGGEADIKAGTYAIPAGASARELLAILQGGRTVTLLVTIPEGMPSVLVRDRLMAISELSGTIPVPEEGSVLPDSYAYEKGETRQAVLARMQAAMSDFLAKAWAGRSSDIMVSTPREALTLASIVEKETSVPAERAIVAGVYTNRLRRGIMLQADPTIIYPITRGRPLGRRIRRSEIAAVNDYNTYAMTGLPKGPIANPSRQSIEAVLHPATTSALYFVADGKGGHIFADTLEEQNENVRKWFEIRRQRGEL